MSRVFNFSAGPSMLPVEVLKKAQEEMLDMGGSGFGKTVEGLKPSVSADTEIVEGRILNSASELKQWVKEF